MDTGIATRLRKAGLEVREVDGWKTRGRPGTFAPKGGVNHHTAGHPSKTSPAPSLGIVTVGRPDLIGPLCNVLFGLDKTFYVVAAGIANHAGLPDVSPFHGMTGNSSAYGIEVEHDGLHPLGDKRVALLATAWAAIFRGKNIPASQLFQHWEWAPSRKIDLATNMHGDSAPDPSADEFRQMVAAEIKRLNTVTRWTVSFKNQKGDRIENTISNPEAWTHQHPGAYQRGKVILTPKRA